MAAQGHDRGVGGLNDNAVSAAMGQLTHHSGRLMAAATAETLKSGWVLSPLREKVCGKARVGSDWKTQKKSHAVRLMRLSPALELFDKLLQPDEKVVAELAGALQLFVGGGKQLVLARVR